jgi:hypothetical protein
VRQQYSKLRIWNQVERQITGQVGSLTIRRIARQTLESLVLIQISADIDAKLREDISRGQYE